MLIVVPGVMALAGVLSIVFGLLGCFGMALVNKTRSIFFFSINCLIMGFEITLGIYWLIANRSFMEFPELVNWFLQDDLMTGEEWTTLQIRVYFQWILFPDLIPHLLFHPVRLLWSKWRPWLCEDQPDRSPALLPTRFAHANVFEDLAVLSLLRLPGEETRLPEQVDGGLQERPNDHNRTVVARWLPKGGCVGRQFPHSVRTEGLFDGEQRCDFIALIHIRRRWTGDGTEAGWAKWTATSSSTSRGMK